MNKKKALLLVTSLGLIGAIGIGATLAYFTDSETVENTVTMGNVNIDLTEESTNGIPNGEGGYIYGEVPEGYDGEIPEGYRPLVPGDVLDKRATVTVEEGSVDAHIRMQVTLTMDGDYTEDNAGTTYSRASMEEQMEKAVTTANTANSDADEMWTFDSTTGWAWGVNAEGNSEGVGYFYCLGAQAAGEVIPFMNNFEIPTSWDNYAADKGFAITLVAEAVQDDHFDVDANGIWDEVPTIMEYIPAP